MSSKRLLLLDDDPVVTRFLSITLGRAGYECIQCNSPKEALGLLEKEPFDLLLLDHHMPEMNSLEVMQAMKAKKVFIPTVVITSEKEESIFAQCIELGALDFLSKPVSPTLLERRVEIALAQKVELNPALIDDLSSDHRSRRFVPPTQRQAVRSGVIETGLGDSTEVVLMGLEVRGSEGWRNQLSEGRYGQLMSELYDLFSGALETQDGWIDSFGEGSLRAVFEGTDIEARALRSAVKIQKDLFNFNRQKKDSDVVGLEVGISIHRGQVQPGTFGGQTHVASTLMGSPLIACKEIERLNRRFKARILISEVLLPELDKEEFPMREVDLLPFANREKPLGIYEVYATDPSHIHSLKADHVGLFTQAIQDFRSRRFEMALRGFGECFSINNSDGISLEYIHRCHYFVNHPPREESWLQEINSLKMVDWSVRRRYVRKPCEMKILGHSQFKGEAGSSFEGTLCEISVGGARAFLAMPVRDGDSLLITLKAPDGRDSMRLAGRVVWTSNPRDDLEYPHQVGLEILALSLEAQGKLKDWIGSLGRVMMSRMEERILFVGSNSSIGNEISSILQPEGFEIDILEDGTKLFDLLGEASYCSILLDLEGLGEVGLNLLKKLKNEVGTADIPVIVLTGGEDEQMVISCLEQGAEDFIKQPFSPLTLKARLRTTLGSSRQREDQMNRLLNTQRRLREHVFQTEVALRAKSAFISTVNHELRTPLNGILGAASILKAGKEEVSPELDLIERSGLQLLKVLNGMLSLVSQDTESKLQLSPYWIRRELQEATKTMMLKKPEGIRFQVRFDIARDHHVLCDQGKLDLILFNLVDNAFKFTGEGMVKLSIKLLKESEENVTLRFDVRDDGRGIRTGDLERIFTPFTQADQKLNREHEGLGLGLAISSKFAKLMGSRIECNSEPEQGSHFWFELKLKKEAPSQLEEETGSEALGEEPEEEGLRLLVAEDNEENQLLLKAFFKKMDQKFDLAENGREAFEKAKSGNYDLILMDVHMPEMDGLEATRLIREHEQSEGRRTVIVALTALSMSEDRQRCLDAGMDDHLSKPIQFKTLKAFLARGFKSS